VGTQDRASRLTSHDLGCVVVRSVNVTTRAAEVLVVWCMCCRAICFDPLRCLLPLVGACLSDQLALAHLSTPRALDRRLGVVVMGGAMRAVADQDAQRVVLFTHGFTQSDRTKQIDATVAAIAIIIIDHSSRFIDHPNHQCAYGQAHTRAKKLPHQTDQQDHNDSSQDTHP